MVSDLFEESDYKTYLNKLLSDKTHGFGWGARSQLSQAIGCQTAYVARVLSGSAHFSFEQADAVSHFLKHTEEQSRFFVLLVSIARAGTSSLREHYQKQISRIREERLLLKNRLNIRETLTHAHQAEYYSSWVYIAVHILTSIPEFQSISSIAARLGLETERVRETLEFLSRCGMVEKKEDRYIIGTARIHLGADSPLVSRHHLNWRLKAMQSIEKHLITKDFHYSSVVSLSQDDMGHIREILMQAVERCKHVIKASPEEALCSLSLDFFEV
ncbi:MAG: TIGR02147 family protein [Bdellovibrionota bacterium]